MGQNAGLTWPKQSGGGKCSTVGNMMKNWEKVEQTMAGLKSLETSSGIAQWRSSVA
jgi:hypothetical protein